MTKVNDKSLKDNFEKIKKETDALLKRMYFLNPGCIKAIPVMVVVLFDPNKSNFRYMRRVLVPGC
jgi:hypothetical protein